MPKISELTVTTGLTTGDYFVIVQGGNSRKIKIDDFWASIHLGINTTSPSGLVGIHINNNMIVKNALYCERSSGSNTAYNYTGFLNYPGSADSQSVLYCYSLDHNLTTGHAIFNIDSSSLQVYFEGLISAASVVDRTPYYTGDAVIELKGIVEKDGNIDHDSLPTFMQKTYNKYELKPDGKTEVTQEKGRSLGGAVSMLITAVQQLSCSLNKTVIDISLLNDSVKSLDERIKAIEKPVSTISTVAQAS